MILANGIPRSGTHSLQKACWLLGRDAHHGHWLPADELPAHTHHLYIKRDPRNVVCSTIRAEGRPVTSGMVMSYLSNGNTFLFRFPQAFDEMIGWLSSGALVVTYERFVESDAEMRRIAEYLGVPYLDDAWPNLPGATLTWNPNHVDWRSVWTDQVAEKWAEVGGERVLREWGYG